MNPAAPLSGESALEWKNSRLVKLIWPLAADQILSVLLGATDTVMVASLGENAVGGVSLVDSVNVLVTAVFGALTTGGAVVCSQYLGRGEPGNASLAAKQLIFTSALLSLSAGLVMFFYRRPLLRAVYGHIEPGIMKEAETNFLFTSLSCPFVALGAVGSSLFRCIGNSRIGMWISLLANIVHLGLNALFIFVLRLGVAGAALSTLTSRFIGAVLILVLLRNSDGAIQIRGMLRFRLMPQMVGSVLRVAVPNALEMGSFHFGKLVLVRLVSIYGTVVIAGNALGNLFMNFCSLPGNAIAQVLLIVVGQCMGAGDYKAVRYQTRRLLIYCYVVLAVYNAFLLLAMPLIFGFFGRSLSAESLAYGRLFAVILCGGTIAFWVPTYCLPYALRAVGDGKYTMIVSSVTMWTVRVGCAYLLAYGFGAGAVSVWICMVCEYVFRSAAYITRWKSGKWQTKRVI